MEIGISKVAFRMRAPSRHVDVLIELGRWQIPNSVEGRTSIILALGFE